MQFQNLSGMELERKLNEWKKEYEVIQSYGLSLNMSRGKPSPEQLDKSMGLLEYPHSYILRDGTDARNYGVLEGILECREFFGSLLHMDPDSILMGGTSSLNLMFDTMAAFCLFGTGGHEPWAYEKFRGKPVKFLCPVPGYDRHFACFEKLGIEMIPVPMTKEGPDMESVRELVEKDSQIKGIWCVPLYSNPQGGVTAIKPWNFLLL